MVPYRRSATTSEHTLSVARQRVDQQAGLSNHEAHQELPPERFGELGRTHALQRCRPPRARRCTRPVTPEVLS